MSDLAAVQSAIVSCERCERLRTYCRRVAQDKRAAFSHETYWGRPVPGFGDPNARILLVALAPAAHGANRTGRPFTGDGPGGSGDFLMTALHANGLANQPFSRSKDDGLELKDVWIGSAVRCAPPGNKPSPGEIAACHPHFAAEVAHLRNLSVVVALGRIAFDATWRLLAERGIAPRPRPAFGHGATYEPGGGPIVIASYHPSRQNTNTGKLTPPMLRSVLRAARTFAEGRVAPRQT